MNILLVTCLFKKINVYKFVYWTLIQIGSHTFFKKNELINYSLFTCTNANNNNYDCLFCLKLEGCLNL